MTTWILCPNLRGARLFQCKNLDEGVRFVREFPHPQGHFAADDFDSDNDVPEEVQEPEVIKRKLAVAGQFAHFLGEQVERGSVAAQFDALLLCAEPKLLGMLRQNLGKTTRKHLIGEVAVDLYDVNETDLLNYVRDFVQEAQIRRQKIA